MDPGQPYRNSDESPLEALATRAPDETMIRRASRRHGLHVGVGLALYYFFGLIFMQGPAGIVALALFVLGFVWLLRQRGWRVRRLHAVLATAPVPVEHIELWQRDPGSAAVVDLVLAEPSRIAERVVRVISPTASVVPGPDCLHVSWAQELNERSIRLAHLLTTLLPHHRELGLVRVRFAYRPRSPAALAP